MLSLPPFVNLQYRCLSQVDVVLQDKFDSRFLLESSGIVRHLYVIPRLIVFSFAPLDVRTLGRSYCSVVDIISILQVSWSRFLVLGLFDLFDFLPL